MPRISAHAYLVEVRELNARSTDNLKFGKFDGKTSLRNVIRDILSGWSNYAKVPAFQRVFMVEKAWGNTGPLVGVIKAGEYGTEGEIVSSVDGSIKYRKGKTEASPDQFYFHLELPDDGKRGILCLQQTGLHGVKGLFESIVTGEFEKKHPSHRLHIRGLTMADALQDYLKRGSVEEVIVEKHEIPADIADKFGGQNKAYPGKFTYSIKPSSSSLFNRKGLIAYSRGEKTLDDVFSFDEHGFDVVKTKVNVGGEVKVVNLTRPDKISSSVDLTNDLTYGADGHPSLVSLKREFEKVVKGFSERGGIKL